MSRAFGNFPTPKHTDTRKNPTDMEKAHDTTVEGPTRCDACKSCGAIVELAGCSHRFHARCIFKWPIANCEICAKDVTSVRIFRAFHDRKNQMTRKGKWSVDEHKYANMMMKQFQHGALPLVDGLHLRGFVANLLQCDPLRITKKYAGHAIGKQNFSHQQRKGYSYSLHVKLQKKISSLRNHFYWHIQYRCKLGYKIDVQQLKAAETDYWIREFLKFAERIGQPVEPVVTVESASALVGSPLSPPPKVPCRRGPSLNTVYLEAECESSTSTCSLSPAPSSAATDDDRSTSDVDSLASPVKFCDWGADIFPDFLANVPLDELSQKSLAFPQAASAKKCSLGDWILEEEARWNKAMTATSYSFSLSDL